jgi:asparagine N-glycosylation enzyme membrane subunit Stt3
MFQNYKKILGVVALVLLVPFLGNFFVSGWNWSLYDFIFAFVALSIFGFVLDIANRNILNSFNKIIVIVSTVFIFLVLWVEAATGGLSDIVENYLGY